MPAHLLIRQRPHLSYRRYKSLHCRSFSLLPPPSSIRLCSHFFHSQISPWSRSEAIKEMMNRCAGKESGFAACEVMRDVAERHGPVVCPKPRRLTQLAVGLDPVRPLRWQACSQSELLCESKAGTELLEIFLTKGGEARPPASSPPPFFCGSPPSRASNPLVHDARFGEERPVGPSLLPRAIAPGSPMGPPATSSSRKGCGPAKFGLMPATMRIEGFDCLDRDRRVCGITAIA